MILPSRKFSLVLLLLTGCLCICEAASTSGLCNIGDVITIQSDHGYIHSSDVELAATQVCQLWYIQLKPNATITIRVSAAHFDKTACDSGSQLVFGPAPFLNVCGLTSYPVVYRSENKFVWIKYVIGSQPWQAFSGPQFTLEYVTSSSSNCSFTCFMDQSCIPHKWQCNGKKECHFGEDELSCEKSTPIVTTEAPEWESTPTRKPSCFMCFVVHRGEYGCLPAAEICDGTSHCRYGEDELSKNCGNDVCYKLLEEPTGWFASPKFPGAYPSLTHCSWVIHKQGSSLSSTIQLRVVSFNLEAGQDTDYMSVYDGPDSTYRLIGTYYGANLPPHIIESTSNWMNIVFKSDYFDAYRGFNCTYQIKGECLPSQRACEGEHGCYDNVHERCNGIWNCPLKGSDETGCGDCSPDDYSCNLQQTSQCYHPSERCNGRPRCSNRYDEINCTSDQCGSHNGTFLCNNKLCIYESWTCDQRDDCGDNSDERFCTGTTRRVIMAAICGSMICALLLVILLGCSCKLYSLRTTDPHQRYPRHETPMSRMYAEFLRRRAPPPYHEAMLTSRNFDEVQQEYLERMRNARPNHRGSRGHRRRTRNQQNQSQTENGETYQNQPTANGENPDNLSEGANSMQLCTINEGNENQAVVDMDRMSSTAELLPSSSETELDSDDIGSETDLAERSDGLNRNNDDVNGDDDDDDDDDDVENILASTSLSAQWMRNIDSDDCSDDACILNDGSPENLPSSLDEQSIGQRHYDNASIDTEATVSIASIETHEIQEIEMSFKESENASDSEDDEDLHNSRNSTPKPDSRHGNAVISGTSGSMRRGGSQGSLNSIGSETCSESEVPLLMLNSVASQRF